MTVDSLHFTFRTMEDISRNEPRPNHRRQLVLETFAGIALTAAFPLAWPGGEGFKAGWDLFPREVFAYFGAAFFYRLHAQPHRRLLWAGWAGCVHFLTLLFWLNVAMMDFAGMPWFLALPVHLLLAGYCALYLVALPPLTDRL
ncbi:MAG: hypothetical protein AAFX94_20640, partial [Myxococcota bacterium]